TAVRQRGDHRRRQSPLCRLGRRGARPHSPAGPARNAPSRWALAPRPSRRGATRWQLLAFPTAGQRGRAAAARIDRRRCRHTLAVDRTGRPPRCVCRDRRCSRGASPPGRGGAHRMTALAEAGRLPLLKAAYVIARRDFVAILFSRAFFFFLLGPLFPVVVGVLAGGVGQRVENVTVPPQLGVAMEAADVQAIMAAQQRLQFQLGRGMPEMIVLARLGEGETFDAEAILGQRKGGLAGVLSGTPERPTLTVTPGLAWWSGPVGLIAAEAQRSAPSAFPDVQTHTVATSGASEQRARLRTAQAGQLMLFLLTMLLAGMVLSNLVEEKGNKIIEILAAAVPMDAVFLGKLFAMLAISLVGIAVWALAIGSLVGLLDVQGLFGGAIDFTALPAPGVGWAAFLLLAVTYFATGFLLLGSIFLAVGSLATTVREVQT